MTQHYCLMCGTMMQPQMLEGRQREQCPACGWVYYRQVKLSAGVLIERAGQILLFQRAHEPWKGAWNLPAGYVEVDETPEQAAIREVREETGLEVSITRLLGNYFFDDDPRGNGLLVLFAGQPVNGRLLQTSETMAFGTFSPDALPEPLCGAAH
ncbi:MAG: NUDIX hydrolase, partial [Anaerolineales bacterium]